MFLSTKKSNNEPHFNIMEQSNSSIVKSILSQMRDGDYNNSTLLVSLVKLDKQETAQIAKQMKYGIPYGSLMIQGELMVATDYLSDLDWFNCAKTPTKISRLLKEAIIECERGIEKNDANCMVLLGFILKEGLSGSTHYSRAIHLFEDAIKLGNSAAMNSLAKMHLEVVDGNPNYLEATRLFQESIKLGNVNAMNNLALIYQMGLGTAINYPEAIRLYELGIELNDADAMTNRATMHILGQGGKTNDEEAMRLLEEAIHLGSIEAMINCAFLYKKQGNYKEAIRLYESAIKFGNITAMIARAFMHLKGLGGEINYKKAVHLLELVISLDNLNVGAINLLATVYLNWPEAEVCHDKITCLLELAIQQGSVEAMINLANVYMDERTEEINYAEAIRLLELAISKGSVVAKVNRAFMHMNGLGSDVNYPQAIYLYEQVLRQGDVASANVALSNLKLINFDKPEDAHQLLELVWNDLIKGESFTEPTLTLLKTHCRKEIKARLSSFPFTLTSLKEKPDHPLSKILDKGEAQTPIYEIEGQRALSNQN